MELGGEARCCADELQGEAGRCVARCERKEAAASSPARGSEGDEAFASTPPLRTNPGEEVALHVDPWEKRGHHGRRPLHRATPLSMVLHGGGRGVPVGEKRTESG